MASKKCMELRKLEQDLLNSQANKYNVRIMVKEPKKNDKGVLVEPAVFKDMPRDVYEEHCRRHEERLAQEKVERNG